MAINDHLYNIRRDFALKTLDESSVSADPFRQFETWYSEAISAQVPESNAFILSTVSSLNKPSSRVLLLRENTQNGFVFYTNYNSRKSLDILNNPNASMLFFWPQLERQIRIEGTIEKYSEKDSDKYFESRPLESRIGAWASQQSEKLAKREVLENKIEELKLKFKDDVPRPSFWGGFILKPLYFEYWQGRSSRLHDRIIYESVGKSWTISRLFP